MRTQHILDTLDDYKVMDTALLTYLFFNQGFKDYDTAHRKCQCVMKNLWKKRKVKRWHGDTYIYGEKSTQWEHRLLLNYVRAYLESQKNQWEKVHCFNYESTYPVCRPDGFLVLKNEFTKSFKFLFIELERHSDRNKFDKVQRYNSLFEELNKGKLNPWWTKLTDRFPPVLIVCQTETRLNQTTSAIQEFNSHGLRFEVKLLNDVRRCLIC